MEAMRLAGASLSQRNAQLEQQWISRGSGGGRAGGGGRPIGGGLGRCFRGRAPGSSRGKHCVVLRFRGCSPVAAAAAGWLSDSAAAAAAVPAARLDSNDQP